MHTVHKSIRMTFIESTKNLIWSQSILPETHTHQPAIELNSVRNHLSRFAMKRKRLQKSQNKAKPSNNNGPKRQTNTTNKMKYNEREKSRVELSGDEEKKIELRVTTKEIHVHTKRNFKNKLNERKKNQ